MVGGNMVVQFNANQSLALNIVLAYIMFAISLEMEFKHFKLVFSKSKPLLVGLLSQIIILPALTLGLIWILRPSFGISLGMLLISVCPGGNVSNYAVHLAKGNTALSIVLTSISTLFSAIHVPVTFLLLITLIPSVAPNPNWEIQLSFLEMVKTVSTLILLPVIFGLSLKRIQDELVKKVLPFIKISSLLLFAIIVAGALYSNWEKLPEYVKLVFGFVFLHNGLAMLGGFSMASLAKLSWPDKKAITIETGIQNSGLALILSLQYFPDIPEMALLAAWWSIWHLLTSFGLSYMWRRI